MKKPSADKVVESLLAEEAPTDRNRQVRDAISHLDDEMWRKIYDSSKKVTTFTATKRVESEAFDPTTRKLCDAGDTITVLAWHSYNGPTSVRIKSREKLSSKTTCIPFSWVVAMGAPDSLASYMPPVGYTWEEVMSALDSAK